jgi:prevent-host-death family protein
MRTIRAAEARANFAALLRRVSENRESVVIERHGKSPVAVVPVEDLPPAESGSGPVPGTGRADEFLRLTQFAVDHASDAVFWIGPDAGLIYANRTASRFLGYSDDELLKLKIFDIDPEVDEDNWPRVWERIGKKSPFTFEGRHRRKDGSTFPVEVSIFFLRYGGEEMICSLSRDITERRAAEDARRESEDRLRHIFNESVVGTALVTPNGTEMDGRFIQINRAFCEMLGYSEEELLGMTINDVTHPEDREPNFRLRHRMLEGLTDSFQLEKRYIHKTGRIVWARLSVTAVRDEDGRYVYDIGHHQDITDLKRAEEDLRASQTRLIDAIESIPDGFALYDADDRLVLCNERYRDVYPKHADILSPGSRFEDMLRIGVERGEFPAAIGREEEWVAERLRAHADPPGPIEQELSDGRWLRIEERRTREGGIVGLRTDITERRRAEEALRTSEEQLRLVAGNLPVLVTYVDSEQRYRFVNRTGEEWLGRPAKKIIGRKVKTVLGSRYRRTRPHIEKVLSGQLVTFEDRATFGDGITRDIQATFVPHREPGSQIQGYIALIMDITERKQAERELRESRRRFQDFAEASADWFWEMDEDLRFTYMSENIQRILGVAPEWHYGKTREDLLSENYDRDAWDRHLRALREHRPFRDFIYNRVGEGVEPRWLRASGLPVFAEDGTFLGYRGTGSDVTAQMAAEAVLRQSEERFRSVVDNSPAAIFLKDRAGCYRLVNRQFEEWYGFSDSEANGKTSHDLFPEPLADRYVAMDQMVLETGQAQETEFESPCSDGSTRSILATTFPVVSAEGKTMGVGTIHTDITDLKLRDAALKERETLLRQAHRVSQIGHWSLNPEDDSLSISPEMASLLGVPHHEVNGIAKKAFLERFVHTEDRERVRAKLDVPPGVEWRFEIEYRLVTGDGSIRWVRETGESIDDAAGQVVGGIGLVQDITDHKQAEDQLRQAQKMEAVGQLTGGVAHDFNNLLGIIMGNAEILSMQLAESDRNIEAVIRAVTRGAELTQRLLAFSRKQTLQSQAVEINALIAGMIDLLGRTLGETIEIKVSYAPGLWQAEVDPGQLENSLLNLAINARDAMPEGGTLVIEAGNTDLDEAYAHNHADVTVGDYVVLSVSDSGSGMSADILEHALEPFFTTKDVGEGSGMGLAMIYGFVKQSGGHLAIDSEVGQGTTVRLYLPRAAEEAAPEDAEETGTEALRARGETVLVVEDNRDIRQLAVDLLEELGYRVLQAPDGWAALSLLEKSDPPDLLLSDVVLPRRLSGPDLAEKVKLELPTIKVLFMSGYADDAARDNGVAGNGTELLNKPFRKHELASMVRGVLDR